VDRQRPVIPHGNESKKGLIIYGIKHCASTLHMRPPK